MAALILGACAAAGAAAPADGSLAAFESRLQAAPLFFAPPPPAGLEAAVDRLASADQALQGALADGEELHPIRFLRAYAAASRSYAAFAAAPSRAGALALLDGIQEAVDAYAAEAASIAASVDAGFPEGAGLKLAGDGGANYTDQATVRADFALIAKSAAAARAELKTLRGCLDGDAAACAPPPPLFADIPAAEATEPPAPLTPARLRLRERNVSGPFRVRTACWEGRKEAYLYYGERCEAGGACMEWEHLASGPVFRPVNRDAPMDQGLRARGLKLDAVNMATLYGCPDDGYMAALGTLDAFAREYGASSVLPDGTDGLSGEAAGAVEAARRAEKAYFAEAVKSQGSLERLGRAYAAAARVLPQSRGALRDRLQERAGLVNGNVAALPLILNRVAFHLENFRAKRAARPGADVRLLRRPLLLTRVHYALVFLTFTPTVWRLAERPAFVAGALPPEERKTAATLSYEEAVRRYGQGEVDKALSFYGEHGRRGAIEELGRHAK